MMHKPATPAAIFSALGEPSRLRVFETIIEESRNFDEKETSPLSKNTVGGLAQITGLSQSTISYHVKILHKARLIKTQRVDNKKYLFPTQNPINVFQKISTVLEESFVNDVKFCPLLPLKNIELQKIESLIDFLTLNGYRVDGTTGLKGASYGSIRFHVFKRKQPLEMPIHLNYFPITGEVSLSANIALFDSSKPSIDQLSQLIEKYLSVV